MYWLLKTNSLTLLWEFLLEKKVAFPLVLNYVTNTWAKFGFQKVIKDADDSFYFKFASIIGLEHVLEHGPWLIRNQLLILTKWAPNLDLEKYVVTKVPVWVKIHKPWGRMGFARALIEVMAEKELKHEVKMVVPKIVGEGHTIEHMRVEYEWKPPWCNECRVFGHESVTCLMTSNNVNFIASFIPLITEYLCLEESLRRFCIDKDVLPRDVPTCIDHLKLFKTNRTMMIGNHKDDVLHMDMIHVCLCVHISCAVGGGWLGSDTNQFTSSIQIGLCVHAIMKMKSA
ncbi:hypothetical protein Tco_0371009 [Tanacetum coccineum]